MQMPEILLVSRSIMMLIERHVHAGIKSRIDKRCQNNGVEKVWL